MDTILAGGVCGGDHFMREKDTLVKTVTSIWEKSKDFKFTLIKFIKKSVILVISVNTELIQQREVFKYIKRSVILLISVITEQHKVIIIQFIEVSVILVINVITKLKQTKHFILNQIMIRSVIPVISAIQKPVGRVI